MTDSRRHALAYHGNPDRIFLSGHSAGAQLAACAPITDWGARGVPADVVKGALLMSGMYDLYPVMLSSRSSHLKKTTEEETAFSPMRHLHRIACLGRPGQPRAQAAVGGA